MKKIKQIFCGHDYELINQFEMKSEFDIIVEAGRKPYTFHDLTRKMVTDYKCKHCSKIKRLVEMTA